jgi:hypothetical protein
MRKLMAIWLVVTLLVGSWPGALLAAPSRLQDLTQGQAQLLRVGPGVGSVGDSPVLLSPQQQSSRISWRDAYKHVGQRRTVCGPVASTKYAGGSNGSPTFLDLGRAFPDSSRFTVVIWGQARGKFAFKPEQHYRGRSICVTGSIRDHRGIAQIHATQPSQIVVQ